jgi:MoxR-like ATPase
MTAASSAAITSVDALTDALSSHAYVAERGLATAIYLALKLKRPLFLEGEAGVGKTEIAKVLADVLGAELIRLQCYEGLDVNHAVYEWNYTRQMLHIRLMEAQQLPLPPGERAGVRGEMQTEGVEDELFGPKFLLKRPLLQAIDRDGGSPAVLLIDELDRSDEEFEAFLLEVLSDYQITIPEIGTIKAKTPPVVIITSNRTREIHDALKRRCIYQWIDYPNFNKELLIVTRKVPHAPAQLARQVTMFVQELRRAELYKLPGVAETLDWITALVALDAQALDERIVDETLGVLLKYQDDVVKARSELNKGIMAVVGAGIA